jgi:hypothetical protein
MRSFCHSHAAKCRLESSQIRFDGEKREQVPAFCRWTRLNLSEDEMVLCENAYCVEEIAECSYTELGGRKFCCIACAEDWKRQNEALIEAAEPFHTPAPSGHRGLGSSRSKVSESERSPTF